MSGLPYILTDEHFREECCCWEKLGGLLGIEIARFDLSEGGNWQEELRSRREQIGCLLIPAPVVERLLMGVGPSEAVRQALFGGSEVFVYGFAPGEEGSRLCSWLSRGALAGIEEVGSGQPWQICADAPETCRQLSGLTLQPSPRPGEAFDRVFQIGKDSSAHSLVAIGGRPFLARLQQGACRSYWAAMDRLADLESAVPRGYSVQSWFSVLLPALLYLRRMYGRRCWQPQAQQAGFIIDDPLLRKRYGFVDYRALVSQMERRDFATTIAFIPWNYRRTDPEVAPLFRNSGGRLSLCVHGCDHTAGEFGQGDLDQLSARAWRAIERMRRHQRSSGIPFAEAMVFPQGVFCRQAIRALQLAGFQAAVNSSPYAVDEPHLSLRDFLNLAVTRYSGFPVFFRRYPRDIVEFAFDFFLGRPALLVEHHGFLKDGGERLLEWVERLNALQPGLRWGGVGEIVSRACLMRRDASDRVEVLVVGDGALIENPHTGPVGCRVLQPTACPDPVEQVLVDGQTVAHRVSGQRLEIELQLPPGRSVRLEIRRRRPAVGPVAAGSWPDRAKVGLRRRLSEFRDNRLSGSERLMRVARRLKGVLPV